MSNRFVLPLAEVQTSSGSVGSGYKLEFFESGTSTNLDTYSDDALSSANANPVVADSAGRWAAIFLKDQDYKVTLSDADDVQIWSADPVRGAGGSADNLLDDTLRSNLTTGGSANAYTLTLNSSIAIAAGTTVTAKANFTNTDAATLNVTPAGGSAHGAKAIKKYFDQALVSGDIENGQYQTWIYDGTNWQLLTPTIPLSGLSDVGGRLTLTTGTAVTTSDVTAATTIYFTPHRGDLIALYDGTATWEVFRFSEISIAVPATTSTMYDVFVYDNAGTPTLELTAWTNDTTRATALVLQNGVYVKTGATTRRYLGSCRTTGVSGQTEDSIAKRYLWNYYNRVPRILRVLDGSTSWTYTTDTFRQTRATASNQLDFVRGVSEDFVIAEATGSSSNDTTAGNHGTTGIGLDSTSVNSATIFHSWNSVVVGQIGRSSARYEGYPAVGRHTMPWLEKAGATGTTTWRGTTGTTAQTGIVGQLLA